MKHWKYRVEVGGVVYNTYSPIHKSLSINDFSEKVIIGYSQVRTGTINHTASKDWIKDNVKKTKALQTNNGFTGVAT